MEKLSRDELYSLGMQLDLPDLLQLCATNKNINEKLCNRNDLWINRLNRDFKDRKELAINNPKDLYILLWSLNDFKKQLSLREDIYTIYSLKKLKLSNRNLTKLPSSIRFLTNLQELYADNNQLKNLPNRFPNSLQVLNVDNNNIEKISDDLPEYLEVLSLENNQLKELPDRLPNSLKYLYVERNKLKKLPNHLPDSIRILSIFFNEIKELPDRLPISLQQLFVKKKQLEDSEINRITALYPNLHISYIY